jgi:RNA polymerase sigma-70 factor (ECF subfamily)
LKLTRWRILDQFRKRSPHRHQSLSQDTATGTRTVDKVVDPKSQDLDAVWNLEWEQTVLEAALLKVKRRVDPQKFQIFDLYVNKEWSAARVAEAFGVSIDQVYLAKHRVTEAIKEEVSRLELEMT